MLDLQRGSRRNDRKGVRGAIADFEIAGVAGEMRGFEIFFKATVEFPRGANLDCAPAKDDKRPEDCSNSPW